MLTTVSWLGGALGLFLAFVSVLALTGTLRFSAISDSSNGLTAPRGSLAVGYRVATSSLELGDTILLGAGGDSSTLGEIVNTTTVDDSTTVLALRGAKETAADAWTHEVGPTTYRYAFSVPLIGFLFQGMIGRNVELVAGALTALLLLGLVLFYRFALFAPRERKPEPLVREESPDDGLAILAELFREAGAEPPTLLPLRKGKNA